MASRIGALAVPLTVQQFIIGFIEYARTRGAAGVLEFDSLGWPAWSSFLFKFQDEAPGLLPSWLTLEFDGDAKMPRLRDWREIGVTINGIVDVRFGNRYMMICDTIGTPEIVQHAPQLVEEMFERAKKIPGFLYFRT